jgi:uncharacterized protein (TIGR02284 family)
MLRSRAETALDDVLEACKEAADHYGLTASARGAGELVPLFQALQQEHAALAAALEKEIRRRGNLPSEPDADREAVEHLFTRVRAALSHDEQKVLLDESERVETQLLHRIDQALELAHPPGARAVLDRLRRGAAAALERLQATG